MKTAFIFVRGLPGALKEQFRRAVHGRGDKMNDVIEALMGLYLDKPDCISERLEKIKKRQELPA